MEILQRDENALLDILQRNRTLRFIFTVCVEKFRTTCTSKNAWLETRASQGTKFRLAYFELICRLQVNGAAK